MEKIKRFSKSNIKGFRSALKGDLQAIGEKYGIDFELGSISYEPQLVKTSLVITTRDEDGNTVSPYVLSFKRNAYRKGFKESDLGRKFKSKGIEYVVTGWRKGGKYTLCAEKVHDEDYVTGKTTEKKMFRFQPAYVLQQLREERIKLDLTTIRSKVKKRKSSKDIPTSSLPEDLGDSLGKIEVMLTKDSDEMNNIEQDRVRDWVGANFDPEMNTNGWGEVARDAYALNDEQHELNLKR